MPNPASRQHRARRHPLSPRTARVRRIRRDRRGYLTYRRPCWRQWRCIPTTIDTRPLHGARRWRTPSLRSRARPNNLHSSSTWMPAFVPADPTITSAARPSFINIFSMDDDSSTLAQVSEGLRTRPPGRGSTSSPRWAFVPRQGRQQMVLAFARPEGRARVAPAVVRVVREHGCEGRSRAPVEFTIVPAAQEVICSTGQSYRREVTRRHAPA
jgi:hypothetical protein